MVTEANVPAASVVGIAPGENIHERINGHVIDIPHPMRIDLHPSAIRPHPHDSATQHGQLFSAPVHRIVEPKITDSNVDPAINTHLNSVGSMIGSLSLKHSCITDMFDQGCRRSVGYPILILIFKNDQVHTGGFTGFFGKNRMQYKQSVPERQKTPGIIDFGKNSMLFGLSVIVTVC